MPTIHCWNVGKYPDGKPGKPASEISDSPASGLAGADGIAKVTNDIPTDFPVHARGLRLLAIEAERRFILGDLEEAAALAKWILSVGTARSEPELVEPRRRASGIIAKMETGSSPVGMGAPQAGFEAHLDVMEVILKSQSRAFSYVESLREDSDNQVEVQKTISWARGQLSSAIAQINDKMPNLVQERANVVAQLDDLTSSWQSIWQQVMQADEKFKAAVAAKAGDNCEFLTAVVSVASIATAVASGGAGYFAAAGAFAKLNMDAADSEATKEQYKEDIG